jgi:glycosyltransferase involved in cell wall biosynthesis
MRFIVDCRKYNDSGIGTYIRSVIPRVVKIIYPFKVTLLVPKNSNDFIKLFNNKVDIIVMNNKPFSLGEQFEFLKILKKGDIFWATSLSHPLFYFGPFIATIHDVAQLALSVNIVGKFTKIVSYFYLYSIKMKSILLFYNSLFTKCQFYYYFGSSRAQEIVTPLGVEDWWCERRAPKYKRGDTTPYFICVGNVRPHKNLNILFQAFSTAVNVIPHQLVVVGEHEGFRTSVANFTDLLDTLGERVRFLGRISDADLFEYISSADALIFPSLY